MKDLSMLVWLTQLGLSTAGPLAGCVLLALWLQDRFHLGKWVIVAGLVLGIVSAVEGLRASLKAMRIHQKNIRNDPPPPTAFNDHH